MVLHLTRETEVLCLQMVHLTSFGQTLPIFADKPFIGNTFLSSNYHSFNENLVGAAKFYLDTIHGLNDEDVRISKRRGFKLKKVERI